MIHHKMSGTLLSESLTQWHLMLLPSPLQSNVLVNLVECKRVCVSYLIVFLLHHLNHLHQTYR